MLLKPNQLKTLGLIYRQLILYWRHLDRKFEVFFWPTVDGVLFGAIGTYAARGGSSHALVLMMVGFVMAQVVWQSHIHLSKFFMQETWDNNVLYMMTRPLKASNIILAAVVLAALVAAAAAAFIAVVVGVIFGLDLLRIPVGVILLIPVLMVLGWATGLLSVSLVLVMGQKADNFVWAIYGLIGPLSGSIVPVKDLPLFIRPLALSLPTTYAYEAGRDLVFGQGFPLLAMAEATGGAAVMMTVAVLVLRSSMTKFRRNGFISRYV